MPQPDRPSVSVIVATRNEEHYVRKCLQSVLEGTLATDRYEIVVVDGMSSDGTRAIVQELAKGRFNVQMIDNPARITPVAFNLGVKASRGRCICILSAHSYLEPDYLEKSLAKLDETGADVVGGPMVTLPGNDSRTARFIMAITTSRFGVGGSPFRVGGREGFVDTVVFGVYRREVFERVGLFDERLVRNQDNELNARLRRAGGKVYMVPSIKSYYYNRTTMDRLLRQNFRNGLYGVLTWRVNPASFTLRHAAPLMFVLFLIFGGLLSALWHLLAWPYLGVLALYVFGDIASSVQQAIRYRSPLAGLLCTFMFPALHLSYGLGTLTGVFRFGLRKPGGTGPQRLAP